MYWNAFIDQRVDSIRDICAFGEHHEYSKRRRRWLEGAESVITNMAAWSEFLAGGCKPWQERAGPCFDMLRLLEGEYKIVRDSLI